MNVPRGTSDQILDWVDDDPTRAEEALEHEYAGRNRLALINELEAIASREEEDMTGTKKSDEPTAVETVESESGTQGLLLTVNGTTYAFDAQQVAALKAQIDQAVSGLNL